MEITPAGIKEYEACARYYDFKNGEDAISLKLGKRQELSEDFMRTVKKTANYYFYKKQAFNDPTLKSLYNRWQKDWFGDTTAAEIAQMQNSIQQRSKTAFSTRAVEVITLLFEEFKDVSGSQVFWLNESYSVPFVDKKAVLTGQVDLVLRQKEKNRYHIFKWAHSNEKSINWLYDLVSADYALRYRIQDPNATTRHYVWNFYGNKLGRVQVELEQKDFDLMAHYAEQLVNDELYVPRYGYSTYCKSCPYEKQCINWQMPKPEAAHA